MAPVFPVVQQEEKKTVQLKMVKIDGLVLVYPAEAEDVIVSNIELRAQCNIWGCLPCTLRFYKNVASASDQIRSVVLPEDGYIIDLGCHIGTVSLPLARNGFSILAIDGSRESVRCLHESKMKNNLNNIYAINAILSDGEHECDFNPEANPYNAIQSGNTNQTTTLDTILNHVSTTKIQEAYYDKPCSLIKIDVEAYEPEVLRGAIQTIKSHWPVLYVEINTACLHDRQVRANDIFEYLDDLEYEIYIIDEPTPLEPMLRKIDIHNVFPFSVENIFAFHKTYDKSRLRLPIGPDWDANINQELLEHRIANTPSDSPFYNYYQDCKK